MGSSFLNRTWCFGSGAIRFSVSVSQHRCLIIRAVLFLSPLSLPWVNTGFVPLHLRPGRVSRVYLWHATLCGEMIKPTVSICSFIPAALTEDKQASIECKVCHTQRQYVCLVVAWYCCQYWSCSEVHLCKRGRGEIMSCFQDYSWPSMGHPPTANPKWVNYLFFSD